MQPPPSRKRPKLNDWQRRVDSCQTPRLQSPVDQSHDQPDKAEPIANTMEQAMKRIMDWASSGEHDGLDMLLMRVQSQSATFEEHERFMGYVKKASAELVAPIPSLQRTISPPASRPTSTTPRLNRQEHTHNSFLRSVANTRPQGNTATATPPARSKPPNSYTPRSAPTTAHANSRGSTHGTFPQPSTSVRAPPKTAAAADDSHGSVEPPENALRNTTSLCDEEVDDDSIYPAGTVFQEHKDKALSLAARRRCSKCGMNDTVSGGELCSQCSWRPQTPSRDILVTPEIYVLESPHEARRTRQVQRPRIGRMTTHDTNHDLNTRQAGQHGQRKKRQRPPSVADSENATQPARLQHREGTAIFVRSDRTPSNGSTITGSNNVRKWREPSTSLPPSTHTDNTGDELWLKPVQDPDTEIIRKLRDKNEDLQMRLRNVEAARKEDLAERNHKAGVWETERNKLKEELDRDKRFSTKIIRKKDEELKQLAEHNRQLQLQVSSETTTLMVGDIHDYYAKEHNKEQDKLRIEVAVRDKEIAKLKRDRVFEGMEITRLEGLLKDQSSRVVTPSVTIPDPQIDTTEIARLRQRIADLDRKRKITDENIRDLEDEVQLQKAKVVEHQTMIRQVKPPTPPEDDAFYKSKCDELESDLYVKGTEVFALQQENKRLLSLCDQGEDVNKVYPHPSRDILLSLRNLPSALETMELSSPASKKQNWRKVSHDDYLKEQIRHRHRERGKLHLHKTNTLRKQALAFTQAVRITSKHDSEAERARRSSCESIGDYIRVRSPSPAREHNKHQSRLSRTIHARSKQMDIADNGDNTQDEGSEDVEEDQDETEDEEGNDGEVAEHIQGRKHRLNRIQSSQEQIDYLSDGDEGRITFLNPQAMLRYTQGALNMPDTMIPVIDNRKGLGMRNGKRDHRGEIPRASKILPVGRNELGRPR
jgi:hypothetical protein